MWSASSKHLSGQKNVKPRCAFGSLPAMESSPTTGVSSVTGVPQRKPALLAGAQADGVGGPARGIPDRAGAVLPRLVDHRGRGSMGIRHRKYDATFALWMMFLLGTHAMFG